MSEQVDNKQEAQQEPKEESKVNPVVEGIADLKKEVSELKANEAQKASALQEHINRQQQEALDFFQDEAKKRAVLAGMSQQEANVLLEGIEQGKVTRRELEVRAKYGLQQIIGPKEPSSAPATKAVPAQGAPNTTYDEISRKLMNIQRDASHPIHNPHHKDHYQAKKDYEKLDKQREQLVS